MNHKAVYRTAPATPGLLKTWKSEIEKTGTEGGEKEEREQKVEGENSRKQNTEVTRDERTHKSTYYVEKDQMEQECMRVHMMQITLVYHFI